MQFTTETEEGNFSSLEGIPSGPLGLTLRNSSSFINLIESKLAEEQRKKMEDFVAQPMSEKLRASVLPASQLIIGSWQRISMNEDLIARIYFTRRRIVWEVLEGALKSKIEVQWSDISAIRDHTTDNGFGVLEIQLNQPPSFFREINPQPRKHANWQPAPDFTRGQASICRKHTVHFPPGTLDKHYEKLLQSDRRLFDLSRKPFPNHELNPYFNPNPNPFEFSDLPADITGNLPEFFNIQHNYHVQKFPPPPILPPHPNNSTQKTGPYFSFMDPDSPMSVMDPLFVDEGGRSYAYENQRGNNQGVNINIRRLNYMPMATAQGNDIQNYSLNYGEEFSRIINQNNLENHQLGYTQATCLNEMSFPDSIYPQQYAPHHQVSDEGININSAMNVFTSQYAPAHQVSIQGMNVNSPMNTSMYQYEPPQQASNEGMDVNSPMNVFTSQFEPPQQDSNEGVNVDSLMNWGNQGVNNHFQGLNSIDMATAQGNANQNYCLNFGEMNNPSNTENHLLGDTQVTCFDDLSFPGSIYPQQFVPPHQVPNEGMIVNSPMNRFVSHNAPPHLVSNESMNVNSPMNTSMYQYGQPQQVSKEGMNVNSSVNTFIHQYVPPQQVPNEGMNVNSSMNTSTCPYALPELTEEDFETLAAWQNEM